MFIIVDFILCRAHVRGSPAQHDFEFVVYGFLNQKISFESDVQNQNSLYVLPSHSPPALFSYSPYLCLPSHVLIILSV